MSTTCSIWRLAVLLLILGAALKPVGVNALTKPALNNPQLIANQAQARSAVLPQRNLQIEIRQQGSDTSQRSSVDAQGRVIVQPGRSRSDVVVGIDQSRLSQDRRLEQQAWVLNGRNVSFTLGQTVPLRVVQVLAFNGNLHFVPSSILIERNTGFSVRPLWYGDDVAEVEISTVRTQSERQSKATTTLQVQINEWITIAQSEDTQTSSASGNLSRSGEQTQSSLRIEMRVSVR
jgi:hypothetical protein